MFLRKVCCCFDEKFHSLIHFQFEGRKEIWYLQPWSSRDFAIRGLADRIFDIPELTHLYPDIPKEQAFGRFRSMEGMMK